MREVAEELVDAVSGVLVDGLVEPPGLTVDVVLEHAEHQVVQGELPSRANGHRVLVEDRDPRPARSHGFASGSGWAGCRSAR